MSEKNFIKLIRVCPECGGEIYVEKLNKPIQECPRLEIRELHSTDCTMLPVIWDYPQHNKSQKSSG